MLEVAPWSPDAIPKDGRPIDCFWQLSNANRTLVIHGNYLTQPRKSTSWPNAAIRMSIVYCPRTHERFGHSPYPLQQMLEAGALVACSGTGNRASNPDLDLLAEIRPRRGPSCMISPATVLEMGTINGAKEYGSAKEVGSLEPGKFADLAVVQVGEIVANDPFEALFDPRSKLVSTYCRGKPPVWTVRNTGYEVPRRLSIAAFPKRHVDHTFSAFSLQRFRHFVTIGPVSTASKSRPFTRPSRCRLSSFQRLSGAPEMNQSPPLSARIIP